MVVYVVQNKNNALMGVFRHRKDAETWISHTETGYDEYRIENIVVIEEYKPLNGSFSFSDDEDVIEAGNAVN